MSLRKVRFFLAGLLLIVVFVPLANDGRHHWHEFRYLYSAAFYSTPELMHGAFDPGPPPVKTPPKVAAWYVTELLHIYILRQLVAITGLGLVGYTVIKTMYALMLLMTGVLVLKAFRDLGISPGRSALTAGVFVMSPLTVYLGFKLMGEVPSFFFSACALALFASAVGRKPYVQVGYSSVVGLFVALAALCSARTPLLFLGFWVAFVLTWVPGDQRKALVRNGIIAWIVFLMVALAVFGLLGGTLDAYFYALAGFFSFSKPLPMWMFAIFNVGLTGMGLWLCVPFAWMSRDLHYRRFLLVWLAISGLPVLASATNFLEPRYLVTALIPFVGLAALGLEALWLRLRTVPCSGYRRAVLASMLAVIGIGGTAAAQTLMPYESDTRFLVQAVEEEASAARGTVILIPWNYSDFHFLRFTFPDLPIYLVQSAATDAGEAVEDPQWTSRFREMYGERFVPSASAAPAGFFEHRLVYIGWTVLPSLQNLHELLRSLGLSRIAGYVDASQFRNHMTESWLVHDSRFALRELSRFGQYQVYEVEKRASSSPLNTIGNRPVQGKAAIPSMRKLQYRGPQAETTAISSLTEDLPVYR